MLLHAAGREDLAVLLMLMMECYCRPGEPLRIRCCDMVEGDSSQRGLQAAAILLHPFECGIPSKNQEYDQTVLLDLPRHAALTTALVRMARGRHPHALLFERAPPTLRPIMNKLAEALLLEGLGAPHPYRLRHTGASHDFVSKARTLEQIQKKGRWRDPRSLRKYEHGGRMNELLQRLSPEQRAHARSCDALLPSVFLRQRSASTCPWLTQCSWSSLQALLR